MRIRILLALVLLSLLGAGASGPTPARAVSCAPCPATATDDVNLRAGPSLADEVLQVIPAGAALEWDPFGTQANGFVSVTYDGTDGYAHSSYLMLFPSYAMTTDWLNLRSEPSRDATVSEVMPPGAELQVLAGPENGYYAVRLEQRIAGYAHGDYLLFATGEGVAVGDDVRVDTDGLNLRASAGLRGRVRTVLPDGARLVITAGPSNADGYTWYQVDAGVHGTGWVAGEFVQRV